MVKGFHGTVGDLAGCVRFMLLGLVVVLVATSLGGCFWSFPRRPAGAVSAAPGRIEGRIVDERGQALIGASATIPEVGQLTAITGNDGRFTFDRLAPGTYYVRVNKEGYLAGSFGVTVSSSQTAQLLGQLGSSAGKLHGDSTRVPSLCGSCHVLHGPTPNDHLIKGASANSPCFTCHTAGMNQGFDESVYGNSPHGPAWVPDANSPVQLAWTGQPASDRGNCSTCHEPHGISGPPFMLRKGVKNASGVLQLNDLCYECHSSPGTGHTAGWPGKTAYTSAGNKHATIVDNSFPQYAAGDCGICHVAHGQTFNGNNYPAMTRANGNQLCLKCHPDKAVSQSGHGDCTLCHDPHDVGTAAQVKVKNPVTGVRYTVTKEAYRNESLLPNSYCLACHKTSPPTGYLTAKNPFAATTNFKNSSPLFWQGDTNLHNVHVNRVWSAGVTNPYTNMAHYVNHYGSSGDTNRVRCNQCHRVHQRKTGDLPLPYNLGSKYISSITRPYSGGVGGSKVGCGARPNCHSCYWCHSSPGSPAPDQYTTNACWQCSWHQGYSHSGVDY